jgi:nitrite reductase/ring-hydroxylating ferredoxin subunit
MDPTHTDLTWQRLCAVDDLFPPMRFELEGRPPVAVFQLGDEYFITDDTCSHGAASLCDGFVEGEDIECPWHGGKFCIRTGAATAFPAELPIRIHPVRVQDGQISIGLS